MNLRRVRALTIVMGIILFLTVPVRVRALSGDDVPGVPYPVGNFVEGIVGGAVYDLVYSIQVPAASVLVVTVKGETGAELGLYAFGEEAQSIFAGTPLSSSAKAGGVQTISLQFVRESVVYLNVNGRNSDRAYHFTLRANIVRDNTAPIIMSVVTPRRTTSNHVCVTVRSTDPVSGIVALRLIDSAAPTDLHWLPFSGVGTRCVAISPGDGTRTVNIQVRNGVNLESLSINKTIVVDDSKPELIKSLPEDGIITLPRGNIIWQFSEPIQPLEGIARLATVVRLDGSAVQGSVSRSVGGTRLIWTPDRAIPIGTTLIASLGGVQDAVGNVTNVMEARLLTRMRRVWINARLVRKNGQNTLIITTPKELVGEQITVESKTNRSWVIIERLVVPSTSLSLRVTLEKQFSIRIRFIGSELLYHATSATLTDANQ